MFFVANIVTVCHQKFWNQYNLSTLIAFVIPCIADLIARNASIVHLFLLDRKLRYNAKLQNEIFLPIISWINRIIFLRNNWLYWLKCVIYIHIDILGEQIYYPQFLYRLWNYLKGILCRYKFPWAVKQKRNIYSHSNHKKSARGRAV